VRISPQLCGVLWLTLALLPLGCDRGSGQASRSAAGSTTSNALVLAPPTDLIARVTILEVRLTWEAPAGGSALQGYGVYRDGVLLEGVSASETTFVDNDVAPGRRYAYEVRARGSGAVSEGATVGVRVRVPPLRVARLVGDFAATARLVTRTGYPAFEPPTYGWHFRALCHEGPCDVRWRDLRDDRIHATLERRGARYTGHYSDFLTSKCFGARAMSSVDLSLEVAKARPISGEWRATKLVGSLTSSLAQQLGCSSPSFELSLKAGLRQS
jgi:hypothetical protein